MPTIHAHPVWTALITRAGQEAVSSTNEERRENGLKPLLPTAERVVELAGRIGASIALRTLSMTSDKEEFLRLIAEDTQRAIAAGDVEDKGTFAVDNNLPVRREACGRGSGSA